ncbi:hypothetical protein IQ07DRAFT_601258 [Pyrenochaeta sp. DS3sAY3a]|nr:hypothetical protein IQ07DRAFT_601258 [Pyrenochaeta sp. DS3sAY3a]
MAGMLRQGALVGLRLHHQARCSWAVGQHDSYSHERARAPEGASGCCPACSPCTVLINVEQIVCYSSSRRAPWSRVASAAARTARPDATRRRGQHKAMGTQQRREVTAGAILLRLVLSFPRVRTPAQSSAAVACIKNHGAHAPTRPRTCSARLARPTATPRPGRPCKAPMRQRSSWPPNAFRQSCPAALAPRLLRSTPPIKPGFVFRFAATYSYWPARWIFSMLDAMAAALQALIKFSRGRPSPGPSQSPPQSSTRIARVSPWKRNSWRGFRRSFSTSSSQQGVVAKLSRPFLGTTHFKHPLGRKAHAFTTVDAQLRRHSNLVLDILPHDKPEGSSPSCG